MIYKIPATYDFGKTAYRNFYSNRIAGAVSGAKSIRAINKHMELAPSWSTANQIVVPEQDSETEEWYDTYIDSTEPSDARLCNGAVDIDVWLKANINNDVIECNVSFICSLVKQTGLMSQEDLDIFIDHKVNYVRKTKRGRKIVAQYHRLGAIMQRKMEEDLYRHAIYKHLYITWLADVVECIKQKEFDKAEKLYFEAIEFLAKRYKLEKYLDDFPKQTTICTDEG